MKENYFENSQKQIEVFVEDIMHVNNILKKVKKIIKENAGFKNEKGIFIRDDENLSMTISCLFKEKKILFYFSAFYDLNDWKKESINFKEFMESLDCLEIHNYEAVLYLMDAEVFVTKDSLKVKDDNYHFFGQNALQLVLRNISYEKFSSFSYSSQNCNLETIKSDGKTTIKNFWAFHNFSFIEIKNGKIKKMIAEDPKFVKELYNFYVYNYKIQDQFKKIIKNYLQQKEIIVNESLNFEKILSKDSGLLKLGLAFGFPLDGFSLITKGKNKLDGILFLGEFSKFISEKVEIKISNEFHLRNNELVLREKCGLLEFAEICRMAQNSFKKLTLEENYREKFRFEGKGIEVFIENENVKDFVDRNIENIQKILNEYKLPVRIVGTSGKSILIFFNF